MCSTTEILGHQQDGEVLSTVVRISSGLFCVFHSYFPAEFANLFLLRSSKCNAKIHKHFAILQCYPLFLKRKL